MRFWWRPFFEVHHNLGWRWIRTKNTCRKPPRRFNSVLDFQHDLVDNSLTRRSHECKSTGLFEKAHWKHLKKGIIVGRNWYLTFVWFIDLHKNILTLHRSGWVTVAIDQCSWSKLRSARWEVVERKTIDHRKVQAYKGEKVTAAPSMEEKTVKVAWTPPWCKLEGGGVLEEIRLLRRQDWEGGKTRLLRTQTGELNRWSRRGFENKAATFGSSRWWRWWCEIADKTAVLYWRLRGCAIVGWIIGSGLHGKYFAKKFEEWLNGWLRNFLCDVSCLFFEDVCECVRGLWRGDVSFFMLLWPLKTSDVSSLKMTSQRLRNPRVGSLVVWRVVQTWNAIVSWRRYCLIDWLLLLLLPFFFLIRLPLTLIDTSLASLFPRRA